MPSTSDPILTSAFARALAHITGPGGRFTIEELAEVAECSPKHLYAVRRGEVTDATGRPVGLTHDRAEAICRYCLDNSESRPSEAFKTAAYVLVPRGTGSADGCCAEELAAGVRALVGAEAAHGRLSKAEMGKALDVLRAAMADLQAEHDLLPD